MRLFLGAHPIVHLVYMALLLGLATYHQSFRNKPALCFNMTLNEWNQLIEKTNALSRGLYNGYKDATVTHYYHDPSDKENIFNAKTDSMEALPTFQLQMDNNAVWSKRNPDMEATRTLFEKANKVYMSVADSNKIHFPFYAWSQPERTDQDYMFSWMMLHRLKLDLNKLMAMESIANPYYENDHAHFQIEFVVESNAAYVNHPFQAKLLLIQQSAQPRNILYMVNGDTLSAEKGGGILKNTFKNPGLNTLKCEVQVINPLTKDIKTYRRNVSLMVSPEPN
ncbi:MAG: hypothetical protein IT270_03535 [Saprospiraceae bacterium]|nr:hypothetical protein [Saprospiraceae bacterium]